MYIYISIVSQCWISLQVKKAMNEQMAQLPFAYGGMALAPIRARLAAFLAELAPGDLNGFMFPSSGGEANDCAIRMARLYTGKQKIFNQYCSYHGASLAPLGATGDFRRRFAQDGATGFVKMCLGRIREGSIFGSQMSKCDVYSKRLSLIYTLYCTLLK